MARALFLVLVAGTACDRDEPEWQEAMGAQPAAASGAGPGAPREPAFRPEKVEVVDRAMGTEVTFIAYTTEKLGAAKVRAAMKRAFAEVRRLEELMSSWTDHSEIAAINRRAGEPVRVSLETFAVFEKSLWASRLSDGAFDVSFNALRDVWKFGDAAEDPPVVPKDELIAARKALIDYEKITLDAEARTVRIGRGMSVSLGGIAKGYAIDRAAAVLKEHGVGSFLAQAGGDLYGAGHRPDGSKWVSGIRDPRGKRGQFFATIELSDHAFSTAGDYARSFVVDGKRYHHIIDPRTGYPATACRSVTVWAPDALTADAIDDAVFILGKEKGLALVESLRGLGAVIVDSENQVTVSDRIKDKVRLIRPPTGGI